LPAFQNSSAIRALRIKGCVGDDFPERRRIGAAPERSPMKIGIYNQHWSAMGGGERRTAALAEHFAKRHEVTLITERAVASGDVWRIFGIDISAAKIVTDRSWGLHEKPEEVFDVFINNSHGSTLPNRSGYGVYMCMFPDLLSADLSSYQVVTANSRFTADWIKRKWGYDAAVVYSACRDMGPPAPKAETILSVGRFFADTPSAHYKNQQIMLRTFIDMVREGLSGWELQLVGNLGAQPQDRTFLDELRSEAAGHPIRIETGVELDVLRRYFRQASIYWHATGYGGDPIAQPSRQEHFGMTVVEAMSAGAIPIVFRGGGPTEIVRPGIDGFSWSDPQDLKRLTMDLIGGGDPASLSRRRRQLSSRARQRSRQFTVASFLRAMDRIVLKRDRSTSKRVPRWRDIFPFHRF
jgi:glycosyltransferase involved in cell wall biosynthesis